MRKLIDRFTQDRARRGLGLAASLAAAAMLVSATSPTHAVAQEGWMPDRRVTIVVPFNPGGSADRMARAVASFLPDHLGGAPVQVVNKSGASGALGHSWFLAQPDDGHTLMVTPVHPYMISNILRDQGNFELDDYHFINGQWQDYYMLLINKDQPFQTAQELLDFIKENPGEASMPIIVGDGGHLSTLMILEQLGLPLDAVNFVTYDGGGPMRTAIAGNQVTFAIIAARGSDVIRDDVRPLAVLRTELADDWDAPLINEVLAEYDAEIPIIPADLRTLVAHASLAEAHPERVEALTAAYKSMLESEGFKRFISSSAIGGDWLGPEETQKRLSEYFDLFSQYSDLLNQ